jgi:hypothetical protein
MRIISSAELRNNMKKYLDLAGTEQVVIQRGKDETFELVKRQRIKEPDADYYRAVSMEQMRKWVLSDIDEMYKLPR